MERKFGLAVRGLSSSSRVPKTTRSYPHIGLLRPGPQYRPKPARWMAREEVVLRRVLSHVSFEVLPASSWSTSIPSIVIKRRFILEFRIANRIAW